MFGVVIVGWNLATLFFDGKSRCVLSMSIGYILELNLKNYETYTQRQRACSRQFWFSVS